MVAKLEFHQNIFVYIYPNVKKFNICSNCGAPNHQYSNCKAPSILLDGNRKIFQKILIPKEYTKFKQDESIVNNYGQIMQMNRQSRQQKKGEQTNNPATRAKSITSRKSDKGQKPNNTTGSKKADINQDPNYVELRNRLFKAEKTIDIVSNKLEENETVINKLVNEQKQLSATQKANIEKQSSIDAKLDAIMEKVSSLQAKKTHNYMEYDPIDNNSLQKYSYRNENNNYSPYRQSVNPDEQFVHPRNTDYEQPLTNDDYQESNYDNFEDNRTIDEPIAANQNGPKGRFFGMFH